VGWCKGRAPFASAWMELHVFGGLGRAMRLNEDQCRWEQLDNCSEMMQAINSPDFAARVLDVKREASAPSPAMMARSLKESSGLGPVASKLLGRSHGDLTLTPDLRMKERSLSSSSGKQDADSNPARDSVLHIDDKLKRRKPGESLDAAYEKLLGASTVDLTALRSLAWSGIPFKYRAIVWKLLLGYVPASAARRSDALARKRRDYQLAVEQHFGTSHVFDAASVRASKPEIQKESRSGRFNATGQDGRSEYEENMYRQISVDIPRTCPGQSLFHITHVQAALERVLYVWAMRHPASGYVQGMNDLVTPFFFVFYSEQASEAHVGEQVLAWSDLSSLSARALADAEADAYWCLTALLDSIHDYYIFAQPGIMKRVLYMTELVARVDPPLRLHLESHGVDFIQFAFRWMNCLLMRELPFVLIVRVWDTYLCEPDGFGNFHVFVCAALLCYFSDRLQRMEFQDLVLFLQNLPTEDWTQRELDMVLSQAFMWRSLFDSSLHLQRFAPTAANSTAIPG